MKVLITGGAGFIGSHVADVLLNRGDRVRIIDNFATGRRDNLPDKPGFELVEGTIADEELVNRTLSDFEPEVVVHAAAAYKNPDNWAEDARTNVQGTVNVVRAAKKTDVRRLIYFQTALCYGLKPIEQPITLSHPIMPEGSSYAISKTAGEQYITLSGLNFVSFRLANAYGPRNISGPLPTFYERLTAGKNCFVMDTRRDFIFVDDLIEVVIKAIDGMGAPGYYHVSSGSDFSIKELYDETVAGMRLDPAPVAEERNRAPDDTYSILLDPARTQEEYGWSVRTALSDGVVKTIDYYRKFGVAQTYTHLKLPTG